MGFGATSAMDLDRRPGTRMLSVGDGLSEPLFPYLNHGLKHSCEELACHAEHASTEPAPAWAPRPFLPTPFISGGFPETLPPHTYWNVSTMRRGIVPVLLTHIPVVPIITSTASPFRICVI